MASHTSPVFSAIFLSENCPYDAPDGDGEVPHKGDQHYRAARAVLSDMCDRRGFGNELRRVDEEVRREIVDTLAEIIRTLCPQPIANP